MSENQEECLKILSNLTFIKYEYKKKEKEKREEQEEEQFYKIAEIFLILYSIIGIFGVVVIIYGVLKSGLI